MKTLLFLMKWVVLPGMGAWILICTLVYLRQESILFIPRKLPVNFVFTFEFPHEEVFIDTHDGETLHGLWFKTDGESHGTDPESRETDGENRGIDGESRETDGESRGLIFYLHGNAGAADSWGTIAGTYLSLGYDMFIFDYRGYGKSTGRIRSQETFFEDARIAFSRFTALYDKKNIVLMGYSIGAVPTVVLASENNVRKVILKAPFYSALQLKKETFPFIPSFLLKYPLETHRYLNEIESSLVIIHGDSDEIIPVEHSRRLSKLFKEGDLLIELSHQSHNGMNHNPDYHRALESVLKTP